jgi:hypothetical protein
MKPLAFAIGVVLLAGCAAPTPYQPLAGGQGYAEERLDGDRYRISFAGNRLTDRETVQDYLLYRAAEVTLASGNDYFVVADSDVERTRASRGNHRGRPVAYWSCAGLHPRFPHHCYDYAREDGGAVGYEASVMIVLGRGARPEDEPKAYDARELEARLKPSIVRPGSAG